MSNVKPIKDSITDNTTRTYYALDEAMVKAHREERDEYAHSTARLLLENADLPLLIRARACMVLGCSEESDFLDMAKEAVRITEFALKGVDDPTKFEQQLLTDCKTVLKEAEEASNEIKATEKNDDED